MNQHIGMRNQSGRQHRALAIGIFLASLALPTVSFAEESAESNDSAKNSKTSKTKSAKPAAELSARKGPGTRGYWASIDFPMASAWMHVPTRDVGAQVGMAPVAHLRIGRQINENILVGGRWSMQYQETNNSSFRAYNQQLALRAEWLNGRGTVRKFAAVELGGWSSGMAMQGYGSSEFGLTGFVSAGVHIFPTRSFSVDPYVAVSYFRNVNADSSRLGAHAGFMLSGWYWR